MESGKFSNILLQQGPEKSLANTGKDKIDFDELSVNQQKAKRYSQNTKYRRLFSNWVMWIVPLWLLGVFILVILCGIHILTLSDKVLVALLATTTANILGLAYIVLKGMFPQGKE